MFSLLTLFFIYLPVYATARSFYSYVTLPLQFNCKWFCHGLIFVLICLGLAALVCWSTGAPFWFFFLMAGIIFTLLVPAFRLRSFSFLTYPLFLPISPFLVIFLKLRVIFPHNIYVLKMKRDLSAGESKFEATPQLILQFYVLFLRFDRGVTYSQSLAIIASVLSL